MASYVNLTLLPPSTTVYVNALANAGFVQTVTITPPSGSPAVFRGSGENNTAMQLATTGFLTPPSSGAQAYFRTAAGSSGTYRVEMTSNHGAENVQFAQCTSSWSSGATANTLMVVGEDSVDQDYNDSVLMLVWYTPANQ
jgi:hypothetical protein